MRSGSKQYKVRVGDKIILDKLQAPSDGKNFTFNQVLLLVNDGRITLGKPTIKGAKVLAKLIENKKGEKIRVRKYKAKVRYRRGMGFRPQLSLIQIEKIDTESGKNVHNSEKTTKTAPKRSKK